MLGLNLLLNIFYIIGYIFTKNKDKYLEKNIYKYVLTLDIVFVLSDFKSLNMYL